MSRPHPNQSLTRRQSDHRLVTGVPPNGPYPGTHSSNSQNHYHSNSEVGYDTHASSGRPRLHFYQDPRVAPLLSMRPQEKADFVAIHPILRDESAQNIYWKMYTNPVHAMFNGTHIRHETFLTAAFKPPRHTIMVALGFDSKTCETRGAAVMKPNSAMRCFWIPVSVYIGKNGTDIPAQANLDPRSELNIHAVLLGIYGGLHTSVPKDRWFTLTIHQKLVLATHLSGRRPDNDKLHGVDLLRDAAELEPMCIASKGNCIPVEEGTMLKVTEAHTRLDSYVFDREPGRNGQGAREKLRLGDILGAKTRFQGLRRLEKSPAGDAEAYFLCTM